MMTGNVSLPAVLQTWTMRVFFGGVGRYKSGRGGTKAEYKRREGPKSCVLSMPSDLVCG